MIQVRGRQSQCATDCVSASAVADPEDTRQDATTGAGGKPVPDAESDPSLHLLQPPGVSLGLFAPNELNNGSQTRVTFPF